MLLTGFTLPIIGIVVLAIFYALVAALSAALFFWMPGPAALPLGALALALGCSAGWYLLGRPVARRLRPFFGGPLSCFGARDLARIGSKAGWLAALSGHERAVPPGYVLPRASLWLCHRAVFRVLLWPRLRRFLRASVPGSLIVRSSVAAEDRPGSGMAGRYRSLRLDAPDARSVRALLGELRGELADAGPCALLLQPRLTGPLTLVSSFDPVSGREDLVRVEVYEDAAGPCVARVIERWSVVERGAGRADGGDGALGLLLRCERATGGPVLLELVGEPPALVQVRDLAPPPRETWAVSAFVQGGAELAPEGVDTNSLDEAMVATLRGAKLAVRVEGRRLYFRVRDQLALFACTPWPVLLVVVARAERRAREARARGSSYAVLHLLWARALVGMLVEAARQLEVRAPARLEAALARLALDPAPAMAAHGSAHRVGASPGAARGRWAEGILPWRAALAGLLARRVSRVIDDYLVTRASLSGLGLADPGSPEAICLEDGVVIALPATDAAPTAVPIHPGAVTGPLRRIEAPDDLAAIMAGDVVWSPFSHAWLSASLPLAGAVLVERGGGLTHLALNCRAAGVPCASGVRVDEWADGALVGVRIDAHGCRVEGVAAATLPKRLT